MFLQLRQVGVFVPNCTSVSWDHPCRNPTPPVETHPAADTLLLLLTDCRALTSTKTTCGLLGMEESRVWVLGGGKEAPLPAETGETVSHIHQNNNVKEVRGPRHAKQLVCSATCSFNSCAEHLFKTLVLFKAWFSVQRDAPVPYNGEVLPEACQVHTPTPPQSPFLPPSPICLANSHSWPTSPLNDFGSKPRDPLWLFQTAGIFRYLRGAVVMFRQGPLLSQEI